MSKTPGALARIKAVTPNCTSRHCVLHCQILTVKERREGRKEGREGGREEGKKERRKEGRKEFILFENILDKTVKIMGFLKLNLNS